MKQLQQGDVLFSQITSIPNGVKEVTSKSDYFILAEGEATGHTHKVEADGCQLYEKDGTLFMHVATPVTVIHDEHGKIELDTGVWDI